MNPQRDYSILRPRELRFIQQRAKPRVADDSLEREHQAQVEAHQKTINVVSGWNNTISQNRHDRQTRLQREKEAEEERKRKIDAEEKKIQKLKRQAALAEARKQEFAQRPEVRAVNSKLLLHEVQEERELQIACKERRRIMEMKRQEQEDEAYEKMHREAMEKEDRIRAERRAKAIEVANGFRQQLAQKEQLKQQLRQQQYEEDLLLKAHAQRELEAEQAAEAARMQRERELREQTFRENQILKTFKERARRIDEAEDERVRQLAIQQMDEEERRQQAEEKRKRDRLNARAALIEAEAQRQMATKKEQEDFLEKQLAEERIKDQKRIQQDIERRERLIAERRRNFEESEAVRRQKELEKKMKKTKTFPDDGSIDQSAIELERQRRQNLLDIQQYQLKQMQEKKEREAAEKEREKLEYEYQLQQEAQEMEIAQQYAQKLLAQMKD